MNDLRVLPTPDEFELDTRPTTSASMLSPLRGDSGWLVRMRRDRLLNEQEAKRKPAKFRSMDQLNLPSMSSNNGGNQLSDPSQVDPLHWQLRKEFHLTKYSERRATSSSYQHIEQSETRVERLQPQPPPAPPAITRSQPTSATITVLPGARGKSPQPLYPPGSLEDVASESKPAVRRPEKVVYENHPIAPSSLDKSVDDYPERLMSPPPTHQPRSILKPRPFEQMSEQERHRIMMENLQRHRSMRSHSVSHKPPQTSFNGPFFRLEQVSPRATSAASMVDMKEMSASSIELESIVWPPKEENQRRRPSSVAHTRNIADPERVEEYQRQKRLEEEAIRRREQQQIISMNKQIRAMEIQQRKLQEQQEQQLKEEDEDLDPMEHHQPQPQQDPAFEPHPVNVYETRPLTANQGERDPQVTWQRTYVVEKRPHDIAKNEILTSEELLEKEQYEVDLLKRRETFVEKPVEPPEIRRIGKRWQPPPEKPYVWPTMRRSQSVEPSRMISPINDDDDEYKWEPIVADPGYKREAKNFTPVSSPPLSPRRGTGVGPLDEPARRQTRNVITPSMDGSHRPKAAFKKERQTPSGGFYPHAPNAIKIVKKRSHSVQSGLLMTANGESSHQQNGRRSGMSEQHHRSYQHRQNAHNEHDVADWEKIYELPPHSSQIVQKDIPRHVDVQRRLTKFEGSIQNLRAASSMRDLDTAHRSYPQPDYDRRYQQTTPAPPPPPPPPPQQHQQRRTHQNSRSGTAASHRQMSRRNSVASTRLESPTHFGGGMSRAASVNVLSPTRPITPGASRARNYIARATAPSPTPMAYDKARAYVPPPLPPGYRLADPQPDPRATSPAPGHTRKMIRSVTDAAQRRHLSPNPSSAASSRFL